MLILAGRKATEQGVLSYQFTLLQSTCRGAQRLCLQVNPCIEVVLLAVCGFHEVSSKLSPQKMETNR